MGASHVIGWLVLVAFAWFVGVLCGGWGCRRWAEWNATLDSLPPSDGLDADELAELDQEQGDPLPIYEEDKDRRS